MPQDLDTLGDGSMLRVNAKLSPLALLPEAVADDHPVQSIAAVVIIATRRDHCAVKGL
jgi:hypothetical protein